MAYINKEKTAEIRNELKKQFPEFKISVVNDNYTSINVAIMAGPVRFADEDYRQLNNNYPENYQHSEILKKIVGICNNGNHDRSDIMTDYFDVGWYVHLSQGKWDKPFILTENKQPAKVENTGSVQIIDYSEKAIAVIGDTRPIKDTLKELGGRFNFRLTCGAGWIFPKTKQNDIKLALNL